MQDNQHSGQTDNVAGMGDGLKLSPFTVGDNVFLDDEENAGWYLLHRVRTPSGQIETLDTWVELCLPDNAPGPYITATAAQLRSEAPVVSKLAGEVPQLSDGRDVSLAASVVEITVNVPASDPGFASEPTYTAKMRVSRIEQAMKAWHVADETSQDFQAGEVSEHAVVVMLADLRHYCDAYGLPFSQLDRHAHADYMDQLENDRHHKASLTPGK